jgi:hypothetical protein
MRGLVEQLGDRQMPAISLYNRDWQTGINVEARQGNSFDPNQNQNLGRRRLLHHANWVINSGTDDIQYRRDRDPGHPDGSMTEWTNISSINGDQTVDV